MWTRQVTAPAAAGRAWLHKYPRVGSAPLGIYILQTERTPQAPVRTDKPTLLWRVPMIGLIVTALLQTFCALDQEDDSGYAFHCGEAGGIAAATAAFGVRALELCDDIPMPRGQRPGLRYISVTPQTPTAIHSMTPRSAKPPRHPFIAWLRDTHNRNPTTFTTSPTSSPAYAIPHSAPPPYKPPAKS